MQVSETSRATSKEAALLEYTGPLWEPPRFPAREGVIVPRLQKGRGASLSPTKSGHSYQSLGKERALLLRITYCTVITAATMPPAPQSLSPWCRPVRSSANLLRPIRGYDKTQSSPLNPAGPQRSNRGAFQKGNLEVERDVNAGSRYSGCRPLLPIPGLPLI